jgi:hypothetical protein
MAWPQVFPTTTGRFPPLKQAPPFSKTLTASLDTLQWMPPPLHVSQASLPLPMASSWPLQLINWTLIKPWAGLLLVLVLILFGVFSLLKPLLHSSPSTVNEESISLNESHLPATSLLAMEKKEALLSDLPESKAPQSKPIPLRNDPFRPLVKLTWLAQLSKPETTMDAEKIEKSIGVPLPASEWETESTPSPKAAVIPLSSLMEFIGVVSDENPHKAATVLLKLFHDSGELLLSKRIGSTFQYEGNTYTLTAIKGATLFLNVNGFPEQIRMSTQSSRPAASVNQNTPPRASSQNVETLLNELNGI